MHHLGAMVGTTPLTRLLPDTSDDTYGFFSDEEAEEVVLAAPLFGSVLSVSVVDINSEVLVSDSGSKDHMLSSSLTTSAIDGLESVSSWQHFSANVKNFSTLSEGYDPIFPSITENIIPDWYAMLT
ncbi:unnamed protein product [Linum trigynum]|uniref:Uncharacterized protein n=1 Tax=Linum trigynum TaxID=586398 RepID=A0AAV2GNP3_9ROSI